MCNHAADGTANKNAIFDVARPGGDPNALRIRRRRDARGSVRGGDLRGGGGVARARGVEVHAGWRCQSQAGVRDEEERTERREAVLIARH